ncbi:MAG: hypothetical protein AABM29_11450 [Actinomycetota bacterium]
MIRLPRLTARSIEIGELLDTFLVCGVTMILIIRLQLYLTNYPQLGGHGLHIAHVLWGGLLMMIAIVIAISFITRSARQVAAVLGGLGFGFFIDELGKFITEDVNYFYKPTAALIYIIFIAMWLSFRTLQRHRGFSQREYLVNAIEFVKEAAVRDLDETERRRALEMLERSDQSDPMVAPLREVLREADPAPAREPLPVERAVLRLRDLYLRVVAWPRFPVVIGLVFCGVAVASLGEIVTLALVSGDRDHLSFIEWASIASSLVSGTFALAGLFRMRAGNRMAAYRMFERSVLVSIFVTQVFAFANSEFSAVFALGIYLLLWATLRYAIGLERKVGATSMPASTPAGTPRPALAR